MTLNEYHRLAKEFRQKIVPLIRGMLSYGNVTLTHTADKTLRTAMGVQQNEKFPMELFSWEPVSVEIQDSLDSDQVLVLTTISVPKMVDGKLDVSRANSVDYKCIMRLLPNTVLIVSAAAIKPFRKSSLTSLVLEKKSQTQKCLTKEPRDAQKLNDILGQTRAFMKSQRVVTSKTEVTEVQNSTAKEQSTDSANTDTNTSEVTANS